MPVVNPATEEVLYEVALGSVADVDQAVAAARRAFESYGLSSREERAALLERIVELYKDRIGEIAAAISDEMGRAASIRRALPSRHRARPFRYRIGRSQDLSIRRAARFGDDIARAGWRRWHDYALELAAEPDCLQSSPGLGGGLYHGFEALRIRLLPR